MNKFIIFKDSAYDQHATRMENVNSIYVTSNTAIVMYIRNPDNPNGHSPLSSGAQAAGVSDDIVTITTTADYSDDVFHEILNMMGKPRTPTVEISSDLQNVSAVAYTAGS